MVVGSRMREELMSQKLSRESRSDPSSVDPSCTRPVDLTFGYTSRAVGSFHVALCVAMLPGEGVLGFPAHTRLLRHLSAS